MNLEIAPPSTRTHGGTTAVRRERLAVRIDVNAGPCAGGPDDDALTARAGSDARSRSTILDFSVGRLLVVPRDRLVFLYDYDELGLCRLYCA